MPQYIARMTINSRSGADALQGKSGPRQRNRLSPRRLESLHHANLRSRFWLRGHISLIGLLTLGVAWGASVLMRGAGIESLAVRYAGALGLAYLVYLLLLGLWAHLLARRASSESIASHADVLDLVDVVDLASDVGGRALIRGGGNVARSLRSEAPAGGVMEDAAEIGGRAIGLAFEAEEGAVVAVPVVVVILIAAAVAASAGLLFFWVFGVEVLLAVAAEVAMGITAGSLARRTYSAWHDNILESWLVIAVKKTILPMLLVIGLAAAVGWAVNHYVPQAHLLPEAVKLWRAASP
jgi:hypothetical protein